MVDARGQGAWSGRRSLDDVGGTAAEEFLQIVAELVTTDAVQEEVDGVVYVAQIVGDLDSVCVVRGRG